jgi:hypothetical protein
MQKSDIRDGEEYGVRERGAQDPVLQRVRVLQHVRGKKWKVEWIEPNRGLVDYLDSRELIVRWKERLGGRLKPASRGHLKAGQ